MAPIIQVEGISKLYRLGEINHGMLYRDLQSWWARLRGRPDPNSRIALDPMDARAGEKTGDSFLAVDDVSFTVERGETLGIIGRNGAGKSTLLKLLSRITRPSAGTIRLNGRVGSLLEVGTGFHPELTGRDNVYLNGAILGMAEAEVRRKFDEIVDFAEVGRFIDTPVKRYSSGMYVRLAFAVAAHLEPEILIVDEVLAVGDLPFQKKCLGRMKDVSQQGRTVLFVSHNLTAVNRLCRRSILMQRGKAVADGPTAAVISRYMGTVGGDKKAEARYDGELRAGQDAKVRRVAVCSADGEVTDAVDVKDECFIEVCHDVLKPLKATSIGVEIYSEELGLPIICSNDAEIEHDVLERREPGRYSARIRIPPMILNTGTYRVRCGISQKGRVFDVVDDACFTVVDSVGIFQHLGFERKSSLLSMQIPWERV